jgi:hypothetical protein
MDTLLTFRNDVIAPRRVDGRRHIAATAKVANRAWFGPTCRGVYRAGEQQDSEQLAEKQCGAPLARGPDHLA